MFTKHTRGTCSVFGVTLNTKGVVNSTFKRKVERYSTKGWVSKQHPNEFTTGLKVGSTYMFAKNSFGYYITDPRGYSIPISTNNLADILSDSVVDHGVILDSCIWADNGELKTKSQYDAENKDVANIVKPIYLKMGKIDIGTVVVDQQGREYIWMGAYHTILEEYGAFKWSSSKVQYVIDVRVPKIKKNAEKCISDDLRSGVLQTSVIKFVKTTGVLFKVDDAKAIINHMLYEKHSSKQKYARKYVSDTKFNFEYKFIPMDQVPISCVLHPRGKHNHIYQINTRSGAVIATWIQPKSIYSSSKRKYADVKLLSACKFQYMSETNTPISLNGAISCNVVLWNTDTDEMLSFIEEESVEGN